MSKIIYNRIKAVLAERNVTNKALSEGIGTTVTTVSRWCTNDSQPTIETLFLVADYLGVDVRDLLVANKKSPKG